jgi:hypothetical protein
MNVHLQALKRRALWGRLARRALAIGVIACWLSLSSIAQDWKEAAAGDRSPQDARSFMELFTGLELQLDKALQADNERELESLLAPEFVVRTSWDPQTPISRALWLSTATKTRESHDIDRDSFVIRAFLGAAVVSFVHAGRVHPETGHRHDKYLVVDVWETNHKLWQLSQRYEAPVNGSLSAFNPHSTP